MKQITLSCMGLETKDALHSALAEALDFPDWYGCNLDALCDCLTDLDDPVHLHLIDWDTLPHWRDGFAAVFADAASPRFAVTYA